VFARVRAVVEGGASRGAQAVRAGGTRGSTQRVVVVTRANCGWVGKRRAARAADRRRRGRVWALWESPMRCCPALVSYIDTRAGRLTSNRSQPAGADVRTPLPSGVGGDLRALVGPICRSRCRNPQPSRSCRYSDRPRRQRHRSPPSRSSLGPPRPTAGRATSPPSRSGTSACSPSQPGNHPAGPPALPGGSDRSNARVDALWREIDAASNRDGAGPGR
jgi:hypothetical protein